MAEFVKGDVVIVPFPFSDLTIELMAQIHEAIPNFPISSWSNLL